MFGNYVIFGSSESIEHWEIDSRQCIKEVIKKEVQECGASLEQVKVAIVKEIQKCRNSSTLAENSRNKQNIWNLDWRSFTFNVIPDVFHNIYNIVRTNRNQGIQQPMENEGKKTEVSLSTIDHAYIDHKYVKCCTEICLQEVVTYSKEIIKYQNHNTIPNFLYSMGTIQSLSRIPEPFNQLKYIKLLIENNGLISQDDEKAFIDKFKKEFFQLIITSSHSMKNEVNFLKVFLDFLLSCKNTEIIAVELQLQIFCNGDSPLVELLDRILNLDLDAYGAELTALQEVAKYQKQEKNPLPMDKFKEVVSAYLKPVEIRNEILDGRSVIEATGRCIVISKILDQLETERRRNPIVEEVRIVGADILHIDADFKKEVWHGVNIVIFVDRIKIHDKVVWDVSGKDGDHVYSDNAGTGEDGHGKQGADGCTGESGGNVLIQANEVENPENLTIISNGGNGGSGQDGGDGKDGQDGTGITRTEFQEEFSSVVKCFAAKSVRTQLLRNTLKNIRDSETLNFDWREGLNFFIESTTTHGNHITFSFCARHSDKLFQAFLLYEGSRGQPGGHGGDHGLGGEGGYNGEIITSDPNILVLADRGERGRDGRGGLYGRYGKNGWDMGYMDYQTWRQTQFYGSDCSSKLQLVYHDSCNISNRRVWCPYQRRYAEITSCHIEHKIQRISQERKNVRQSGDRQCQTQAAKKKNISQSKTSADYAHHFTSVGRKSIENLKSSLKNINQQALQAMTESAEQQEKATTEVNVERHIRSTPHEISVPCKRIISLRSCGASNETAKQSFESLNCELKSDSLSDYLLRLKTVESNRSELDQIFIILDSFKSSLIESKKLESSVENYVIQDIEQILNEKYRFAVLQEIAKQLPPCESVGVNPKKLSPEKVAKYLIAVKEGDDNISHPELGTLNKYFFQNSEQHSKIIFKFLKNQSKQSANEAFKRSVGAFVLRVGESEQTHIDVKKYYKEYKEHSEKRDGSLKIFLAPFLSELQRQPHIFALWSKSHNNKAIKIELMKEINKFKFLNALYNRVDKQLKLVYNWDECCNNKSILKEYNRHIREEGQFSESYRELLAYIYNINIRLYIEDQDNRFCLLDDHNPCSKQVVHILRRDNELVPLNVDENLYKLYEERENLDNLCAKILSETEAFKEKQEFDDYLLSQRFLADSNAPNSKYCSFYKEPDAINIRKDYFSLSEEDGRMIECLDKIAPQYIGHKSILPNILKRFSNDGTHVTFQELYCLVNSILTSVIDDRVDLNTFCWIVAAYPQKCWIDELVLLEIENHFKTRITDKAKWREYMFKIENKETLLSLRFKLSQIKSSGRTSVQSIEEALILLSKIPNAAVNLKHLDLPEWPYVLKEKYWTYRLSQLTDWQESGKLPEASYYLLSAENTFGISLVEKFVDILEKSEDLSPDILTEILLNFYNGKWNLSDEELTVLSDYNILDWTKKMSQKFTSNQKDRDITQLIDLIKGNTNTSKEIFDKLLEIQKSIQDVRDEECPAVITEFSSGIMKIARLECQQSCETLMYTYRSEFNAKKLSIEQASIKMLTLIDKAIELERNYKLRDTQKLSILALLANERSTLAQVSTGEGKSLIVVAATIITIALREHTKVDIITSSSVLAKRDAECNKAIYNLFGINVSHNCNEDVEKRRQAYSSSQVVYGDMSNFQRDYLLDRFYGKNILGDRNFENVIVDEVDSLLLDKGNNMLYLSHDLAGFDKLESVYLYIWQWVNCRPAKSNEELSSVFDAAAIKELVLNDLHGRIAKKDIKELCFTLPEQHEKMIWERLIDAKILDDQGKILKEKIHDNELNMALPPNFIIYKDRLSYLMQARIGRKKCIHVPNYLKPFIEQHLENWINNAIMAVVMKQGHDYVLDVDRTGTSPDLNPNVTILDRDTGTDQANSQWDEALHQFLQLKHGCKLSLQSLKAVFISNVSYLKRYRRFYGLTGTLGSHRERDLLKEIHKVDFVTIPTSRPEQFQEESPIVCSNKNEWLEKVFTEATKFTNELKRSVLIICETIDDVETLKRNFEERDTKYVHTYTRDYKEFDIAKGKEKLNQGQIIIATNLSGRGTDIKITEELNQAGGLHVCLTYLPNNSRIEQQAFGRAARNGAKGSGRLIIMDSKGQEYGSDVKILNLKKQRDAEELRRISDIKAHYETQIVTEEYCFAEFQYQYERLKKDLAVNRVGTEVRKILLQSCLDEWAFWLDRNGKYIKNLTDDKTEKFFEDSLNKFISQLKNLKYEESHWLPWVGNQPVQMIKLGQYLCQDKKYKDAIKLFDEVVEREPYFSEAAHYYRAYALAKTIDWETKPVDKQALLELKTELRQAARLFDERRDSSICAAGIINNIKQYDNKSVIQIDAYAAQQGNLSDLYYLFSQSIGKVFSQPVTPESFVNGDINPELSEVLYEDLLRNEILKKPKVKSNISEDSLRKISIDYGIPAGELNSLLFPFMGKEIDEKKFQKTLKEGLKLASREDFWKMLIAGGLLNREVKCIIINVKRLKDVDSTLFEELRKRASKLKFRTQILKCRSRNEILLNPERTGDPPDFVTLEKKDLEFLINNKKKYEFLKKQEIFSSNKKAHLDLGKIALTVLPRYDSITLEDFINENITMNDAAKILAELYIQKVLTQTNSKNGVFRLRIPSSEIRKIQLPSFLVYQNAVISLLSLRFAYRIALEKIEKQIKEKSLPVNLRLTSKPHHNVICELLDQRIIRSAKVNTKVNDLKRTLGDIYSRNIDRDDLKFMLSQNGLNTTEANADKYRDHLVEKRWLSVKQLHENSSGTESLFNRECKFTINDPDERQLLTPATVDYDIKVKIEQILDNRLQLASQNTIAHIVNILERSKSSLKTLEFPDTSLKHLTEYFGQDKFKNMGEVNILTLNGLTQLLQIAEKKWTKIMLRNTFIVAAIGVCEIAIGVVIGAYSTVFSDVGIRVGISDICFAMNFLMSGNFRWEDYTTYKIKNLIMTCISTVISIIQSQTSNDTAQNRHFGNKIIEFLGMGMMVWLDQRNTAEPVQSVSTKVTECVARKVAENGIVFGRSHVGLGDFIKDQLQKLCDHIRSIIISSIENEVNKIEGYNNFAILEEIYQKLGKDSAREIINHVKLFTEKSFKEKISDIAAPIVHSVTQEITRAIGNMQETRTSIHTSPIQDIRNIVAQVSQANQLVPTSDILRITDDISKNFVDNLKDRLDSQESENHSDLQFPEQEQKQEAVQERESFKKDVIDQLKSLLLNAAEQIIEQQIVYPIFEECCDHFIEYSKKLINRRFRSYRRGRNNESFDELKRQYQEHRQTYDLAEVEDYTPADEYRENLLKLTGKTRNHKLLAAIARENGPMDVTCLNTCTRVISKMLGISLTVIVKEEGGFRKKILSSEDEAIEEQIIELELTGNYCYIHCLYKALSDQLSLLNNMTREMFRNEVADRIEQDPDIIYHIKHEWPELYTRSPPLDGRHRINIVTDELWTEIIDQNLKLMQDTMGRGKIEEPNQHFDELAEEIVEDEWLNEQDMAVEDADGQVSPDAKRGIKAAVVKYFKGQDKIATNDNTEGLSLDSSEYSNEDETVLMEALGKSTFCRARKSRCMSLDSGLNFSSRNIAIGESQSHYESLKIAIQQIRELGSSFCESSRNRRYPRGRSESWERLVTVAAQSENH